MLERFFFLGVGVSLCQNDSVNYSPAEILCTTQVIAIVTDRLTDSAIIGDLHYAASHGIPVYIILNQRSFQENFTPNRLKHPVSHVLLI